MPKTVDKREFSDSMAANWDTFPEPDDAAAKRTRFVAFATEGVPSRMLDFGCGTGILMSTAELGLSLAEMFRQNKVHGICCAGANLEEELYNLVAHDHYERGPHYRHLAPQQEAELLGRHFNRVTDTCVPEEEDMRRIERVVKEEWPAADSSGQSFFSQEFLYRILQEEKLRQFYQIDPKGSWARLSLKRVG
jgi:hypothetical protein